jgi:hypothetical protein
MCKLKKQNTSVLDHVQGERHRRCTGAALAVAVSLLEATAYMESGRIMLLTGGPATVGPGAIVSVDYAESLRTHKDLDKGSAKHFTASAAFYDGLAHRLIENGQALDVFACALDQVCPLYVSFNNFSVLKIPNDYFQCFMLQMQRNKAFQPCSYLVSTKPRC